MTEKKEPGPFDEYHFFSGPLGIGVRDADMPEAKARVRQIEYAEILAELRQLRALIEQVLEVVK